MKNIFSLLVAMTICSCALSHKAHADGGFMVKFKNEQSLHKFMEKHPGYQLQAGYPVQSPGGYLWASFKTDEVGTSSVSDVTYRINKDAIDDDGVIYAEPALPVRAFFLTGCTHTKPKPEPTPDQPTPKPEPTPSPTPEPVVTPEPDEPMPKDPMLGQLWGINSTMVPGAWWDGYTGKGVPVAVIDSGVEISHPDLKGQVTWAYDFVNNSESISDPNGHGTHCAGTIAAISNEFGVVGAAHKADLRGYRFLDENGSGNTADAVLAISKAIDDGAFILSNSWGGSGFSQALGDIIEVASRKGILFVAAAGNDSRDNDRYMSYPANDTSTNVLSVCATDKQGNLAFFSNWGASRVHVCAPGTEILSTYKGGKFRFLQGTSMATPLVAGIAALLKEKNPGWTGQQIKEHIIRTAKKMPQLEGKSVSGGIVVAPHGERD